MTTYERDSEGYNICPSCGQTVCSTATCERSRAQLAALLARHSGALREQPAGRYDPAWRKKVRPCE